jgi:two-component system phosphate regulon sensor histidine kinase PhoR
MSPPPPPVSDPDEDRSAERKPPSTPPRVRLGLDLRSRRLRTTNRLVIYVAGVPSLALITVGIIVMATGTGGRDVIMGVLILGMALTVATAVVVSSILLAREAELARLQSEFVSRVSHDLRTPLTSIQMFVETLQLGRAKDPETTQACLDALGQETTRLLALVDRLLDWARIESARRIYEPRRCRVVDVIDAALESFELLRIQSEIELERDVPEGLPDIDVDAQAIVDALANVLQNAARYSLPPRKVHVRARLVGDKVEVAIADNGPGVPMSERHKIFEKFYRGAAARSLGIAGTGLGLAMVRAIVEAHRGSVRVEANEPTGSTFVLALPLADAPH